MLLRVDVHWNSASESRPLSTSPPFCPQWGTYYSPPLTADHCISSMRPAVTFSSPHVLFCLSLSCFLSSCPPLSQELCSALLCSALLTHHWPGRGQPADFGIATGTPESPLINGFRAFPIPARQCSTRPPYPCPKAHRAHRVHRVHRPLSLFLCSHHCKHRR
ncbi:hypothetical protein B0T13DRAFT_460069 [Neurospora crassa]|nr:hypothetical protein B0T13DRAFT_460069 [Neurospora crassa]